MNNRRFLLIRRPHGAPVPADFSLVAADIPTAPPGAFVLRNHFASLDPAQRGWMDDAPSYAPPINLGDAVRATTVGRVHLSSNPDFTQGDWVVGTNAIEDYSLVAPGTSATKIDVSRLPSPSMFLSGLGSVGLTSYFGLLEVGRPAAGDVVLVSGAAGAVGSVVGQLAKIQRCRAIGIAGGGAKCQRLLEDYRFDAAIDYRGKSVEQLAREIAVAAPNGVDIVFENVGGDVLDAGLLNLALRARVIICGLIGEYNSDHGKIGARNLWQLIVKRASMHGFLVRDYAARFPEGRERMVQWIGDGRIRIDEDIVEGIDNAYPAFMRLFDGSNRGKMILKIAA